MNLNKKEVEELISNYKIGKLIKYNKVKTGVANHNWFITTNQGKFVLRCVNEDKTIKKLKSEFEYLNYLSLLR